MNAWTKISCKGNLGFPTPSFESITEKGIVSQVNCLRWDIILLFCFKCWIYCPYSLKINIESSWWTWTSIKDPSGDYLVVD